MNNGVFNSLTKPVPPVRRDVQLIPVQNNGKELLFFYDSMGYLTPNFALDIRVEPVLSLLTGRHSVEDISGQLKGSLSANDLLQFIQLLDTHKVLESKYYKDYSLQEELKFENDPIRPPAFAGESYPAEPEKLKNFITGLLEEHQKPAEKNIRALYAPHIDLRVGSPQYAEAFSVLQAVKPKRVVILATSHYSGFYGNLYQEQPFIGSRKTFQIPGREIPVDQIYIDQLLKPSSPNGFTIQDRAHRIEHSIELHLLFISQLWKHDFEIVPILISGFDELYYYEKSHLSELIDTFSSQLSSLDDPQTFYLISGDLSHVGKKFGDVLPAAEMREKVEQTDRNFLEKAVIGDADKLLDLVADDYDSTRICGFPPLYTFLKSFPGSSGRNVNYHWWDEKERESAVSFGAISYP